MEDNKHMPEGVERLDNDAFLRCRVVGSWRRSGTSNAPSAVLITSVRHL